MQKNPASQSGLFNPRILVSFTLCAVGSLLAVLSFASTPSTANVSLATSNAALTQTSNTSWTLAKTGSVDTSSKTVTWTITATKGTTVAGQLVVSGLMAVTNTGGAGATIGNIVVNLQTRIGANFWSTRSSDVADATNDDAATTAHIDPHASSENLSSFTENTASGSLKFMDANSNTVFSLVPEKTIAPGATVNLLFVASFDNKVLKLATGTAVRAEVLVSFGNSTSHFPSAQNVDINGNGVIDSDEGWIRTIPARLGLTVPAQLPDNGTLTITDSASNITTTGTVTFSNATFNIGSTSGTVSVKYDGGTSGGKITNCADATGGGTTVNVGGFQFPIVGGASLQACDTETIGATTCTPGAVGCGWKDGDMLSYSQNSWAVSPASTTLTNSFNTVYSTTGIVQVGGAHKMTFTDGSYVLGYLPAVGADGALTADLLNPTTSSSGAFGGDVLALQLNVDFTDASVVHGTSNTKFGDLTLCGVTDPSSINGQTVRGFLSIVNTLLGGERQVAIRLTPLPRSLPKSTEEEKGSDLHI